MSYPVYPYPDDDLPYPVAGDTDTIRRFAQAFNDTATALRDAAQQLRGLANESITISLAVDEVREKADAAQGDTDKVAIRYGGAGDVLTTYNQALTSALDQVSAARSMVVHNNDNARYWRSKRQELEYKREYGDLDPSEVTVLSTAVDKTEYYAGQYDAAIAKYNAAVDQIHAAARTASNSLDDVASNANLNDDFWQGVEGAFQQEYELAQKYLAPLLKTLRDICKILKSIVDILSLIVSILSIFIPVLAPLAAALTLVSLALAAIMLICSVVLFLLGKGSLGDVLGDAINLGAGIITSKLGGALSGGKLLGLGASVTSKAADSASPLIVEAGAKTLGARATDFLGDAARDSLINLPAGVTSFVGSNGLDLTLASGNGAWGADAPAPAWDFSPTSAEGMEGFGAPALDMVTGGAASPIAGVIDSFTTTGGEAWNDFGSVGNSFGSFSAVPST